MKEAYMTRRKPVRSLPDNPSFESDRKRAKSLLHALREGDAKALKRLETHHPQFQQDREEPISPPDLRLADAQLVTAR